MDNVTYTFDNDSAQAMRHKDDWTCHCLQELLPIISITLLECFVHLTASFPNTDLIQAISYSCKGIGSWHENCHKCSGSRRLLFVVNNRKLALSHPVLQQLVMRSREKPKVPLTSV